MPALRPGHQRESIDGGTVEPVLHHLPGADRRARVKRDIKTFTTEDTHSTRHEFAQGLRRKEKFSSAPLRHEFAGFAHSRSRQPWRSSHALTLVSGWMQNRSL